MVKMLNIDARNRKAKTLFKPQQAEKRKGKMVKINLDMSREVSVHITWDKKGNRQEVVVRNGVPIDPVR